MLHLGFVVNHAISFDTCYLEKCISFELGYKVGKFNSANVNLSVTVTMVSEANLELTCSVSEESIFRNNTAF